MTPGHAEALSEVLQPLTDSDIVPLLDDPGAKQRFRDGLATIASDDFVCVMVGSMSGSNQGLTATFHGVDGLIEAWRDWTEAFSSFENELEEITEAGDVVVVITNQHGITATGGVRLDNEGAGVFFFEGAALVRAEFHLDRGAAMRAAGLDPG